MSSFSSTQFYADENRWFHSIKQSKILYKTDVCSLTLDPTLGDAWPLLDSADVFNPPSCKQMHTLTYIVNGICIVTGVECEFGNY